MNLPPSFLDSGFRRNDNLSALEPFSKSGKRFATGWMGIILYEGSSTSLALGGCHPEILRLPPGESTYQLYFIGNDEGFAIIAGEHRVGLIIVDKPHRFWIEI